MPAGLGASGYLAVTFEVTMGTYLPPSTAGTVFVPILSESLNYVEDAYYSEQIRQQVVDSTREQGYYHVEGDIVMEVDANYLPYFLFASRHTCTKTGAGDPWTYAFVPSTIAAATTGTGTVNPKTLSIGVIRNGVGFGYAGCVVNSFEFTVDNGILKVTMGIVGLSEATPGALGSPAWVAPELFGAAAHSVYVDTAGTAPAFASADLTFNGITMSVNHNASAQNRIIASRSAAYISYAKTEFTYNTELDFLNKTEYDNFKNNTRRAIKLESLRGGANYAAATEGVQIIGYNTAYDSYPVELGGMADLIMANVTGRGLVMTGGNPYLISCKGAAAIT